FIPCYRRDTDGGNHAAVCLRPKPCANLRISNGRAIPREPRKLLPETRWIVPYYRGVERQTGQRASGVGKGAGNGRDTGLLRLSRHGRTARRRSPIGKVSEWGPVR